MRRYIFILLFLSLAPGNAVPEVEMLSFTARAIPLYQVTLGWRLSENIGLESYRIYRSNNSTNIFNEVGFTLHPDTTYVDSLLPPGHYYWAATCRDTNGKESVFSNIVDTLLADYPVDTTATESPINVRLIFPD